jgi:hypothetical protein
VEAPGGVEPPTNGLGNRCSIQLSYGAVRQIIIARHFTENIFSDTAASHDYLDYVEEKLLRVSPSAQMSSAFIFSFIARCCEAVLSGQQRADSNYFLTANLALC